MVPRPWRTLENSFKEISARNLFLRIMAVCLYKLDLLCLILFLVLDFCSLFAFENVSRSHRKRFE